MEAVADSPTGAGTRDGIKPAPNPRAAGASILCAIAAILAVLYGSLIPFSIDLDRLTLANGFGLLEIGHHPLSIEDLVTNIVIYVPIGAFAALSWMQRFGRTGGRMPATTIALLTSLVAESLQTAMPIRVGCVSDVAMNVAGGFIGAALAPFAYRVVRCVREPLHEGALNRPMRRLAGAFALGLFLYQLAPFDFITTTSELHASFRQARFGSLSPRSIDAPPSAALLYGKIVAAAWFAALGYLLVKARREGGTTPIRALVAAAREGAMLIIAVELLHLFVRSCVFDAADIPLRIAAVLLGAWAAALVCETSKSPIVQKSKGAAERRLSTLGLFDFSTTKLSPPDRDGHRGPSHSPRNIQASNCQEVQESKGAVPIKFWTFRLFDFSTFRKPSRRGAIEPGIMLIWVIGHAIALLIEPAVRGPVDASADLLLPFERLWRAPMHHAGFQILSAVITYGILAALLHTMLRRRMALAGPLTAAIVVLIALDAALLRAPGGVAGVDITPAILALAAATAVLGLAKPSARPRASRV